MISTVFTIAVSAGMISCPDYSGRWSGRCVTDVKENIGGPYTHFIEIRQSGCSDIELRTRISVPATSITEEYEILKAYSQVDLLEASTRLEGAMARWFGEPGYLAISRQKIQTDALLDPYRITTLFGTTFFHLVDGKLHINEESKALKFEDKGYGTGWESNETMSQKICIFDRSTLEQSKTTK